MRSRDRAPAPARGLPLILTLLLACRPAPELPPAPPERVVDCDAEPIPATRTLCLVQVAARRGQAGDSKEVDAACSAIDAGLWKEECHFRGGEELAKAGELGSGLRHCTQAGRFQHFCVTHSTWSVPPSSAPLEVWEALATDHLNADEGNALRARWAFNRTFGTGRADPNDVRTAPESLRPYALGAWALEAIRLSGGSADLARKSWEANIALTGPTLPPERRVGRYDLPFAIEGERAIPQIPGFGGSRRLLGESEAEDLEIALLEGLYFHEPTTAGAFEPFLNDARPRVRYTALRAYRTLPSTKAEEVLTAMANDPDPIVAAHVADALRYQTWRGKGHAPGLKTTMRNPAKP